MGILCRQTEYKMRTMLSGTVNVTYVLAYINIRHPGGGYNLDGKIKATNFVQKKTEEHVKRDLVAKPVVKLATAENFSLTEAKEERLSEMRSSRISIPELESPMITMWP